MDVQKIYDVSYSPSQNAFLLNSIRDDYDEWPADAVVVTEDIFREYTSLPPKGKVRSAGNDGMPTWSDEPLPDKEALSEAAINEKSRLSDFADKKIRPLQYAVDLGIATEEEQFEILVWKKYVVALNRVDVSSGKGISWPEIPQV